MPLAEAVLLAAAVAAPPTGNTVDDALSAQLAPLVEHDAAVGVAAGVIDAEGAVHTFAAGTTTADGDGAIDASTIFEIGSVTKVCTAILLAEAVARGEVTLADPVATHLPGGEPAVRLGQRDATLRHLAQHTSGLPRLPNNMGLRSFENPYQAYGEERMLAYLRASEPASLPGRDYLYSNLGAGLLGYCLGRAAGTDYETLLAARLAGPLGMRDTTLRVADADRERFAKGHTIETFVEPYWQTGLLAGAFAVRSTVDDMLVLLAASLDPASAPGIPSSLATALTSVHGEQRPIDRERRIALGWHVDADGMLWHNGMTGGFASWASIDPESGTAVVVLANTATPALDPAAASLARWLAGRGELEAPPIRRTIDVDAAHLDRLVGRYELVDEVYLDVIREGERLYASIVGAPLPQSRLRLFPESKAHFFYRGVEAEVTFTLDQDETTPALMATLEQAGRVTPAKRVGGVPEQEQGGS